jgi:hypothetical protein
VSAAAVPAVGAAYGGGYFGGQISTAGNGVADYNLVVAPKEGNTSGPATGGALKGQYGGATPTTIQYRTTNAADAAAAQNLVYGGTVSDLYKASALHPLFNTTWLNSATGPNGGTMNLATGGLGGGAGIGGYTDWYVPAKNELEVLYYFLKPETTSNFVNGSGSNANAVTPEPVSTAYTAGSPGQTSAGLFQQGNPQAFTTQYWSSSEVSTGTTNAWSQSFASFNNGNQDAGNKANLNAARAIRRVGVTGIGSSQTLAITGADTDGFTVGMKVKGSSSNATGIITAINGTSVTITQTSATNWTTTDKIQGNGTAITGSPLSGTVQVGATPPSVFIPQASLAVSSTYYARTQYATTNTGAATSDFSAWSSFATAASFLPAAIGSALGGGYFAGQILDGTTVYNLIVAPKLGDTSGPNPAGTLKGQSTASLQYRTSNAGDAAAASNQTYGGTVSDLYKASTLHPLFNNTWLNNSTGPNGGTMNLATGGLGGGNGIGGYTDWYVPAKNELEVLYYYFKPNSTGTQPNDTTSGSNPNAVSPEPISTNYTASNPAQTTATAFQGSNAQAFSTADYWSATENANPILAWQQNFSGGLQAGVGKISANSARAIRRVAA